MNRGLFVTGTDTDVGKTFVASLLCRAFSQISPTTYFKPIQAGEPTDSDFVKNLGIKNLSFQQSTHFVSRPASPNRAAALEGRVLKVADVVADWKKRNDDFYLVEGAGGVLVPINSEEKIVDLARELGLPSIVVASTRLGTINHTLLTVEALKARGVSIAGLVLNGTEDPGLKEVLEEQTQVPVLFEIPQLNQRITLGAIDELIQSSDDIRGFVDHMLAEPTTIDRFPSELEALDKQHVWHPFTQHGIVKRHPIVTAGSGSELYVEGRPVLDAISSWWVNLFGHCHPVLSAAVQEQVQKLEHVIYAGFAHEPGARLAEKLTSAAQSRGANLTKVFYSDNGSTSVEVALKLVHQYFQQIGQSTKKRFLALRGSYHGDTLGAMSVGERKGFNDVFTSLMFDVDFVDPFNRDEIQNYFAEHGDECAAVIVEPMVQGASGMRMYGSQTLNVLAQLSKKHKSLVICDEVFTGFYRTGRLFAFEHSDLRPDLLCLSKGLTGGYLPLAATLVGPELYLAFENPDMRSAFLHGHSYTANPMACRVALASFELIEKEETKNAIDNISQWTQFQIDKLSSEHSLFNQRHLGTIGAFEVNSDDPHYFKGDFSYRFHSRALQKGVLIRPLGGTIYTVPPYCMSEEQLDRVYRVISETIKEEM